MSAITDERQRAPSAGARRRRPSPTLQALRGLRRELGEPRELQALGLLRQHQWQRDIADRIARAIDSAPEDPGPLNPRMLAIRSLTAMGERSPEYQRRFVAWLDTLVWLEEQG
ncbi:DUF2894 domain-containing protein [Haliea atlantica]|nr:hypothetical protein [Haliea sp.]